MNKIIERRLANGKRRIERRLDKTRRTARAAQRGSAGFTGAFGHAGKQLGLHGDGGLGLELKAWWALWPQESPGRWQERHHEEKYKVLRMEFKTFVNTFMLLPCQIVRSGRRLLYRLLNWNPWQGLLFRTLAQLRC